MSLGIKLQGFDLCIWKIENRIAISVMLSPSVLSYYSVTWSWFPATKFSNLPMLCEQAVDLHIVSTTWHVGIGMCKSLTLH